MILRSNVAGFLEKSRATINLLTCLSLLYFTELRLHIGTEFPSLVVVERYGMNGSICLNAWDDNDANVLCRENGYHGGFAIRSSPNSYTTQNLLSPQCNGTELRLSNCRMDPEISQCAKEYAAPVIVCSFAPGNLIFSIWLNF